MYVPLGGKVNKFWSIWLIFLFVAGFHIFWFIFRKKIMFYFYFFFNYSIIIVWHDFEFKLILWAVLNSMFLGLEIIGNKVTGSKRFTSLPKLFQSVLIIFSSATYIFLLISINMIGYAAGIAGMRTIILKMVTGGVDGLYVILYCYFILYIGVCIMNHIKDFKLKSN